MTALERTIQNFGRWMQTRWVRSSDPEAIAGSMIMLVWSGLAGIQLGLIAMLFLMGFALTMHLLAVETGHFVMLFFATATLLVLIVAVFQIEVLSLTRSSLVAWAVMGVSALTYNELVRLNYSRRRAAVVDNDIFIWSAVGLGGAVLFAFIGTGLAQITSSGSNRTWLWSALAAGALFMCGFGFAIGPTIGKSKQGDYKWGPGERIPPQPAPDDDISGI